MWHRATEKWRKSGKLAVIGIVQEQHRDRARLFAQWHEIDWPILWDPLNVTGAAAVPNLTLVDEHGVVRSKRPTLETIEKEFLDVAFDAPDDLPPADGAHAKGRLIELDGMARTAPDRKYFEALTSLLWGSEDARDGAIETIGAYVDTHSEDAAARFRLGVAHRMRHDSNGAQPGDFQRAVDAWSGALDLRKKQYIWRRRIQQYGPLLDKPYPFYPWVSEARRSIQPRDEHPLDLRTGLSGAELLDPRVRKTVERSELDFAGSENAGERITVETVIVGDSTGRALVRLHVGLHFAKGLRTADLVASPLLEFTDERLRIGQPTRRTALGAGRRLSVWVECDVTLPPEGAPEALAGRVLVVTRAGRLFVKFHAPLRTR